MSSQILRFAHSDFLHLVKNLRAPTLICLARKPAHVDTDVVRLDARKSYEATCESFKLVYLTGNHFLHLNCPAELAAQINEFFH